jgi:hypothetical protein
MAQSSGAKATAGSVGRRDCAPGPGRGQTGRTERRGGPEPSRPRKRSEPVSRPWNRLVFSAGREGVLTAPLDFTASVAVADAGWVKGRLTDGRNAVRRGACPGRRNSVVDSEASYLWKGSCQYPRIAESACQAARERPCVGEKREIGGDTTSRQHALRGRCPSIPSD